MYAMYLRKSRSDVEMENLSKEDTLKRHRDILDDLAKRLQIIVADVFTEVVSGETIADRPEIQKLLKNIYQHKYQGVLVVEIERLARGDTKDQGTIAEAFKYTGTKIITPTKIYDPNNEFDEEYFEFGLFMSRREYKTINRRMQRGKISSVKEGNYLASARPYGYNIIRKSKKERTLTIVPEEAEVVRLIFDKFINERLNYRQIANYLTKSGILTYNGKRKWSDGTVSAILCNPVYAGMIRWAYRPQVKSFNDDGTIEKKRAARNSNADMIVIDGKHEAIVSKDIFYAAQERIKTEYNQKPITYAMKNPFSSLVYCKTCGSALLYHEHNKIRGSRERMLHRTSDDCHVKSCFYDDFRDTVISSLRGNISDFEIALEKDDGSTKIEEHKRMIAAAEKNLNELLTRRSNLFDLLERGIYTDSEFIERKTLLDQEREQIESALIELRNTIPEQVDYAEKIVQFSKAIDALEDSSMAACDKNALLRSIIRRIEYSRENDDSFILDIYLK